MRYFILAGSQRDEAQSTKVAQRIEAELLAKETTSSCFVYNMADHPLPLRDDWFREKESDEYRAFAPQWEPIVKQLEQADAFVIVSPEWSGMATPAVKNFFLYCSPQLMGHKPALLVAVSASRGGRYPIAELRMSSYKNTRVCYIPDHLIVDNVSSVLNDDVSKNDQKLHDYIQKRTSYVLDLLYQYGIAFRQIRDSGVIDFATYPNGM